MENISLGLIFCKIYMIIQRVHSLKAMSHIQVNSTEGHKELLETNGWTKNNRRATILDENPDDDLELTVKNPQKISKN